MDKINLAIQEMCSFWPNIILVIGILIYASYTDIKYLKIYDKFNLAIIAIRIPMIFLIPLLSGEKITYANTWSYFVAAIILFLAIFIPAFITGTPCGGDIKFAFSLGLWLGTLPAAITFGIAAVTCIIYRVFLNRSKDKNWHTMKIMGVPLIFKSKDQVPLAPFLFLGYICVLAYYFIAL